MRGQYSTVFDWILNKKSLRSRVQNNNVSRQVSRYFVMFFIQTSSYQCGWAFREAGKVSSPFADTSTTPGIVFSTQTFMERQTNLRKLLLRFQTPPPPTFAGIPRALLGISTTTTSRLVWSDAASEEMNRNLMRYNLYQCWSEWLGDGVINPHNIQAFLTDTEELCPSAYFVSEFA